MFKSIEQGVELYKVYLKKFDAWAEESGLKEKDAFLLVSKGICREAEIMDEKINGMAEALGLTDEEREKIAEDILEEYYGYYRK